MIDLSSSIRLLVSQSSDILPQQIILDAIDVNFQLIHVDAAIEVLRVHIPVEGGQVLVRVYELQCHHSQRE
jgi:hypothetical protein